jgi:anti-sigma regulatory factor (Ser/Thr protein kinase)
MASYELQVEPQVGEISRLIDWVKVCCGEEGVADEIRFKLTLALEEAVMNVVTHAFAGRPPPYTIVVRLDIADKVLAAEVIDNGKAFDPTTAPLPDFAMPVEQRNPGGLGIHLMRGLMDQLHYSRTDGRNILRLEKQRD